MTEQSKPTARMTALARYETGFMSKTKLRNDFYVPLNEKEGTFYIGEAQIYFHGLDVRGGASLTRIDRVEEIEEKEAEEKEVPRRLFHRKPEPIKKPEPIRTPVLKDRQIWSIGKVDDYIYFLYDGKLKKGYDCSAHYRAFLKGEAANAGLNLSDELIEKVFAPIDEAVWQAYLEAKSGGKVR